MPIIDTAQYASATKLKTHTREVIENTHKFWEVFVMHNNTPTAIILSVEKYNDFIENYSPIIGELVEPDAFEKAAIKRYEEKVKSGTVEYISGEELEKELNKIIEK